MTAPPSPGRGGRPSALAALGLVCLVAGLGGFAALATALYGDAPAERLWALRLGLGGSLLASAAAQTLVLIGAWAVWRGLRRP